MRASLIATTVFLLAACQPGTGADGSVGPTSAGREGSYRLVSLNGAPIGGTATLVWEADGRISGEAPCNAYFGRQTAAAPGFRLEELGTTRRACLWLGDEDRYLAALRAAATATPDERGLTLTAADGTILRFDRTPG